MSAIPSRNEYTFELLIALDPLLGFSSGELAELVVDGLLRLDAEGALFPGITDPAHGDRMTALGASAIGHQRLGRPHRSDRYDQLMNSRRQQRQKDLWPHVEKALADLHGSIVTLQMLRAKAAGTCAALRDGGTPSDLERGKAQIAAIERLRVIVEEAVRPLL